MNGFQPTPRSVVAILLLALTQVSCTIYAIEESETEIKKVSYSPVPSSCECTRQISADVVALDQAYYINRIGAFKTSGMMFALKSDVVPVDGSDGPLVAGKVTLRPDKRPRPLVLRMNVGDCLTVNFTNLLAPSTVVSNNVLPRNAQDPYNPGAQSADGRFRFQGWNPDPNLGQQSQSPTRSAGLHAMGMQNCPVNGQAGIESDASWVGENADSLAAPGETKTYKITATAEGAFLLYSTAANVGLQLGYGGQLMDGLFGSITVQPEGAEWYRSQVTAADLELATEGSTPLGQPIVNYDAVYPDGPLKGRTVLNMLQNNEIVHTDLTAIITGPDRGAFSGDEPPFNENPSYPNRQQPYREIAVHYHDDFVVKQAFRAFEGEGQNADMANTLQAGRDFFAINYGMAAIGPPIWANRIEVGPNYQCVTCRYEEFFLSSFPLGDPAMVVDIPANAIEPGTNPDDPIPGPKATKAFYPDDPSNVYHTYVGDHTKYRVVHAGTNITHVHHQHAHQWLHSPNSPDGNYRDSQMITPGSEFTLEYVYSGSGNKNQTVGDSIFHCHFYPHFAQGMWALWRVHDTFEAGTELDDNGRPKAGPGVWSRALPDGEIPTGTPTPAVIPIPTIAMAPMPARVKVCPVRSQTDVSQRVGLDCPDDGGTGDPLGYMVVTNSDDIREYKNPGFPFYIPGIAGQRAPHPPLDIACVDGVETVDEDGLEIPRCKNANYYDGGLPRNIALKEKGTAYEKHNRWDFTKENDIVLAIQLPEEGTLPEKVGMRANAQRRHASFTPGNQPADFILNGQQPKQGAPFADPGVALDGTPILKPDGSNKRIYKGANIELDVVLNKNGWHYPQQRILTLWGDVEDTIQGKRRPEPLFFRSNSFDVVEYWHTNLMPNYYDLDDFQVRTPTDVLGQHIHLVKFDVTASDGAANGFNYEDGTFSPQEVQEQIHAINNNCDGNNCGLFAPDGRSQTKLALKTIPFFGKGPENEDDPTKPHQWEGAQATVQLWYADPLCNNAHAHGPSPCAQDPGVPTEDRTIRTVFTHDHFSPSTHQQAGLYAGLLVEPFQSEWFMVDGTKMGDRVVVGKGTKPIRDGGPTSWQALIVPPNKEDSYREFMIEFQDKQLAYDSGSPSEKKPYVKYDSPDIEPGMEPWGWASPDNAIKPPTGGTGDLPRPMLVSSQFETGTWSMNYNNEPLPFRVGPGTCPSNDASFDLGQVFRSVERPECKLNVQPAGGTPIGAAGGFKFPPAQPGAEPTDPYTPLMRAYPGEKVQIRTLVGAHMDAHSFNIHGINWLFEPAESNSGYRSAQGMGISEYYDFIFNAPRTVNFTGDQRTADYLYKPSSGAAGLHDGNWGIMRTYADVQEGLRPLPSRNTKPVPVCPANAPKRTFEVAAVQAQQVLDGPVMYNNRGETGAPEKKIWDWNALMYVQYADVMNPDSNPKLKDGVPVEPLILRANAGDCIQVVLHNLLPDKPLNVGSSAGNGFPGIKLNTSKQVGLHAQLLAQDITVSDGVNVGKNPVRTTRVGEPPVTYTWYAGNIEQNGDYVNYVPVEFGSVPLTPADPLMQHVFGLIGGLIIEPEGATWVTDEHSRASATVTKSGGEGYREFVVLVQDDVSSLKLGELNADGSPKEGSYGAAGTSVAINYRTEPMSYRFGDSRFLHKPIDEALANSLVNGDPETPVFEATAGEPVRIRLLHPAGLADQNMTLHGHVWQELPWTKDSTEIGDNPLSQWIGARPSFVPNSSFEVVLSSAGGEAAAPGDYLYRTFVGTDFLNGMWGIMRVNPAVYVTVTEYTETVIAGAVTVDPGTGEMADFVTVEAGEIKEKVRVNKSTGKWRYEDDYIADHATVSSERGGKTVSGKFSRESDAGIPTLENEEFRFRAKPRLVN